MSNGADETGPVTRAARPPRDPVPPSLDAVPVAGAGDRGRAADRGAAAPEPWRIRVTEHALVPPSELINSPENARLHPKAQQEAVRAAIHELGFVGEILVSRRSGRILDGHLRVAEALREGQALVPVGWVACDSDEQELAILATHDPIGAMATADRDRFAELADRAGLAADPLKALVATLAATPDRRRADPGESEPEGRAIGAAFGPQGGGRLGPVGGLVHPVVVECPTERDAEILLEQLADEGHAAYLLPASPGSLESGGPS